MVEEYFEKRPPDCTSMKAFLFPIGESSPPECTSMSGIFIDFSSRNFSHWLKKILSFDELKCFRMKDFSYFSENIDNKNFCG